MNSINYEDFIKLVERYKILPFSGFVPEYPSLTEAAVRNDWHTDSETDPWIWRTRIVQDGVAAYGKFLNDKACFVQTHFYPVVRTILASGKSVEERYHDGLVSRTAYNLYQVLGDHGNIDSRSLRKVAGLAAKDNKKEYEKALVELQNFGDVVITGADQQDGRDSGWSSMCYQPSEAWLNSVHLDHEYVPLEDAKDQLVAELQHSCSDKALKYFAKRLKLPELVVV